MKNKITIVAAFIVVLILSFLSLKSCKQEVSRDSFSISTPQRTVEVKLVTKIDTFYIKQTRVIHDTIEVPTLVAQDTIYLPGTKEVATIPNIKRQYSDSITKDSITISYLAQTHGTLDNIHLYARDNRATRTILRVEKEEKIITIQPHGVYLGVTGSLNEVSPSAYYLNNKDMYGVKYDIINKGIGVTYSRRLF